jgi:hypothetical protein
MVVGRLYGLVFAPGLVSCLLFRVLRFLSFVFFLLPIRCAHLPHATVTLLLGCILRASREDESRIWRGCALSM